MKKAAGILLAGCMVVGAYSMWRRKRRDNDMHIGAKWSCN